MLVLSRKSQEQIQIGNNIVVTILKVRGSKVSVGIEAPGRVRILRAEVSCASFGRPSAADEDSGSASGTLAAEPVPWAAAQRGPCSGPLAGALRRARASVRPNGGAAGAEAAGADVAGADVAGADVAGADVAGAEIVSDLAGMLSRSAHGSGRAIMVS